MKAIPDPGLQVQVRESFKNGPDVEYSPNM